jgi:hypothetical protein
VAGGNQSAFGYRYQYLVTIERTLRFLRDRLGELEKITLHVEPTTFAQEGIARDDDIIDFAIELAGEIVERDQVKGSSDPSGNKVYPTEAARVFDRLDGQVASRSILITNRPLSPGLQHKCQRLTDTVEHEEWAHYAARVDGREASIVIDHRSVAEISASVEDLVRQFRSDKDLGRSEIGCRIVSKLLLDEVFRSAAGDRSSRFEALHIVEFIWMPDPEIAQAVGHFDWGVPISGIPVLPATVSRIGLLDELFATIGRPPELPTPNLAVAVGQTGYGKSALAADFCHLNRNSYAFLCWVDCSDPLLIESRIRNLTEELTRTALPSKANPSGRFREALASHSGPWLIVFDGVSSRTDIEGLLPTRGNGSLLITTTNETGWWPTSTVLPVGVFIDAEAVACFGSYAGLDATAAAIAAPAITDIVSRLGRIPLAVSMAGLYFRNAAGTVEELSGAYFAELDALEDIGAIPPGFDRTAFAAIEHAVRNLGAGLTGVDRQDARLAENLLYRASLLAPDLIPLNYLIESMPETINIRLGHLPEPAFADPTLRRRYISMMRTQSITRRVLLLDEEGEQNESSETIEIHPLVHEILRRLFLRQIPETRLTEQLTVMMHFLQGWIVHARKRNQYFVVDQLVAHADSLLKILHELGELPTANAQHGQMFRFTKISLALEVSTCRMSRGNVSESVNSAREALLELWTTLPPSPPREALAMKAATSIVADLSEAGTDAIVMRPWAQHALTALLNCESLGAKGAPAAYEYAYLTKASLNQRLNYREDADIANVVRTLQDLIGRDPSDELRPNEVMQELVAHIDSGELGSADPLLATLRASQNDYDRHLLDCLEADIALRRHDFDQALPAIEELVTRQLYETYGARPLSRGLMNIYRTLESLMSDQVGPAEQLQVLSNRARARAQELHEQIASQ